MNLKRTLGAGFVALALLALVAAGCGDDESATTTEAVTTTQAATTTEAAPTTTTTIAGEKAPAAGVDELVERLYSALNALDNEAFRALVTDDGVHSFYYVAGSNYYVAESSGEITYTGPHMEMDLPTIGFRGIEVLGEPIVSGNAVAVPVAYTYPEPAGVLTGFDLLVLVPTGHGWLVGGAATFVAAAGLEADQAAFRAIIEADVSAFNDGDVEGDLALFSADAVMWDDVTSSDATYTGDALAEFIAESVYFDVEITGELVFSGPFAIVPNRLVAATDSSEGISLYWIRDGLIALHAFGQ